MRATKRRKVLGALALVATFVVVAPEPALAPKAQAVTIRAEAPKKAQIVPLEVMEKWTKVAWCETHGNWQMHGATFSGGLGISNVVWNEYGGSRDFAPHAGLATPEEQVIIATRINKGYVPDQNGCEGAW
jgi:hypothetical protein